MPAAYVSIASRLALRPVIIVTVPGWPVRFVRAVLGVFIAMAGRRRALASPGRFWGQNGYSGLPLETATLMLAPGLRRSPGHGQTG
jgi:hypothetical protein